MKVNVFRESPISDLMIEDSGNPRNFHIKIEAHYVKHAMKLIPKKYRKDIKDNYIVPCTIVKAQIVKLEFLSKLDWIRNGSTWKYP